MFYISLYDFVIKNTWQVERYPHSFKYFQTVKDISNIVKYNIQ